MDPERPHVPVLEPQADRSGSLGVGDRAVQVPAEPRDRPLEHGEEPVLDALLLVLQVSLRAHQPASAHRRLFSEEVLDAQASGVVCGSSPVTVRGVGGIGLLTRGDRFVVLRQPPCCIGEGLQVLGFEIRSVGGCELGVRLRPRLAPDGIAGSIDPGGPLGHELPSLVA